MIREFLEEKYGKFITDQLLNDRNEVIRENINSRDVEKSIDLDF